MNMQGVTNDFWNVGKEIQISSITESREMGFENLEIPNVQQQLHIKRFRVQCSLATTTNGSENKLNLSLSSTQRGFLVFNVDDINAISSAESMLSYFQRTTSGMKKMKLIGLNAISSFSSVHTEKQLTRFQIQKHEIP